MAFSSAPVRSFQWLFSRHLFVIFSVVFLPLGLALILALSWSNCDDFSATSDQLSDFRLFFIIILYVVGIICGGALFRLTSHV